MAPRLIQRFCGLGSHTLQEPTKTISDASMIRFAKRLNGDIDTRTPICSSCYETLEKIYRIKLRNAIAHQKSKRRGANTNSISDVSSSQKPMSQSTTISSTNGATSMTSSQEQDDSRNSLFDEQELRALAREMAAPARVAAPRSVSAEPILQQQNISESGSTSSSQQQNELLDSSTTSSRTPPTSIAVPTKSSSAAAKRSNAIAKRRKSNLTLSGLVSNDSDDEPMMSINAINGTRLPDIQPAPSRRQFHSNNARIMEIYMAGTTGG